MSTSARELEPIVSDPREELSVEYEDWLERIAVRPDVFGGKPIIRDMRISVELILSLLTRGVTTDAILEDYPELEPEDIRACTAYAHAVIAKDSPVSIANS